MRLNTRALSVTACIIPFAVCAFALSVYSCSPKNTGWTSPADAKELSLLESKTLDGAISKKRRAELFFLWGQELAASAQSGTLSEGTSASEVNEKAIAAFEKVVDFDSVLVDESRFNLEILWKRQGQGGNGNDQQNQQEKQNQQDKQNQQNQNGSQDKQGQQDKQSQQGQQGQQGQQDKQSQQDKQGQQGQQDKLGQQGNNNQSADKNSGAEKDLSGLVRDKAGGKDLDEALKAEIDRKAAQQEALAGGIRPVEKDW
jgi:hypothetical protein